MLTGTTLMGLRRETRPARRTDEDRVRCAIIIFAVFALILPARLHARIVTRAHLLRRVVQGDRAGRQRVAAALRVVYFSSRERRFPQRRFTAETLLSRCATTRSPPDRRVSTPLRHLTPWHLRRSPEAHPRLPCALGRHRAMCVLHKAAKPRPRTLGPSSHRSSAWNPPCRPPSGKQARA